MLLVCGSSVMIMVITHDDCPYISHEVYDEVIIMGERIAHACHITHDGTQPLAMHDSRGPRLFESCCNVHGERCRLSGGCLTGCVLRTCWRVLLTGRHVVSKMWHSRRDRHLGRQQVCGECALLFISDARYTSCGIQLHANIISDKH